MEPAPTGIEKFTRVDGGKMKETVGNNLTCVAYER